MCIYIFYKKNNTEHACYLKSNYLIKPTTHRTLCQQNDICLKQEKINYYQRFIADCDYGFACTSQSCLKQRIFTVFPFSVKHTILQRTGNKEKLFLFSICFIQHFSIHLSPYTPIKRYWSVHFIDYGSVLKILSWFRNFDNFRTMG